MRVDVSGIIGKKQALEIKELVRFTADKLISRRLQQTLKVHIRFVNKLDSGVAECQWNGVNPRRPKSFTIRVRSRRNCKGTQKAIIHEMTHVKQFATGELADIMNTKDNFVNFKGKRYIFSEVPEIYWMTPWEIEAHGREEGLWRLFKSKKQSELRLARKKK